MRFTHIKLAALASLSTVLFCGRVQAQSSDSISEAKSRMEDTKTKNSAKQPYKPIRMVCASSIPASRSPLYVVDGEVVSEQDIKSINPNDIDKIDILKDVAATGLYGNRAVNGAVLITLKRQAPKYIYQPEEKKGGLK